VAEVSVPTDRPFPDDGEVYATPLHPDHAVSAAFEPRTGTLARTVYNGYALELRSLSPVVNRGKNIEEPTVVRIMFPDALRPLGDGCIVPSFGDRQLVVLALSTANVLYRFTFPLGLFADTGDRIRRQSGSRSGRSSPTPSRPSARSARGPSRTRTRS
jgi:nuclear pore complex protein Nup160